MLVMTFLWWSVFDITFWSGAMRWLHGYHSWMQSRSFTKEFASSMTGTYTWQASTAICRVGAWNTFQLVISRRAWAILNASWAVSVLNTRKPITGTTRSYMTWGFDIICASAVAGSYLAHRASNHLTAWSTSIGKSDNFHYKGLHMTWTAAWVCQVTLLGTWGLGG